MYERADLPERVVPDSSARLTFAHVVEGSEARLILDVEGYHSAQLAARLGADPGWREAIDCVLIDPAYDGRVFRARVADVPVARRAAVNGHYEIAVPSSATTIAVKLVDVLGEEMLVLLPIESSPHPPDCDAASVVPEKCGREPHLSA